MKTTTQLKKEIEEECKIMGWDYKEFMSFGSEDDSESEMKADFLKTKLQTLQNVCEEIKKDLLFEEVNIENIEELLKKFQGEEK